MALGILFAAAGRPAWATSCTPLQDQYFVSCTVASCQAQFRIAELQTLRMCSRRTRVEDVDDDVSAFLASLLKASGRPLDGSAFMLHLPGPYWHTARSGASLKMLQDNLQDALLRYEPKRRRVADLSPAELVQILDQRSSGWIVAMGPMSPVAIAEQGQAAARQAVREWMTSVLYQVLYWGSFVAALLALVYSVHLYFRRLYETERPPGARRLFAPLAIQLSVLAAGAAALALLPFDFWLGISLAPAVVVILLAEGWSRWRRR